MNNWTGIGNLGKDNDVKFSSGGKAVLSQSLAVRRPYKNSQTGEYETDWISIVLFGPTAENFANFTHKGSKVGIEGRIQSRNYENQQGQRVYVTEVVVNQFHLLDPKNNQSNGHNNSPVAGGSPVSLSNDDLPF